MATRDKYILEIETEQAQRGLANVKGGMSSLSASAGALRGAIAPIAGILAGIGAVNVVGNKIDEFDALAKSARAAGAAGSEEAFAGFQAMKFALAEAGVEAGTADRAFLNISQRMQEGSEGGKAFAEIFETMKGNITNANGELKTSPEILAELINAMNEGRISADDFQKVVGGRAGPVIRQAFAGINDTAEKLNETLVQAGENADIVGLEAAENAEVFNDNIGRLQESMGKLLTEAITPLLPHLVRLSEEILANMPAFIEGVVGAFETLEPVLSLIGTVLTDLVFPIMQKVFEVLGFIAEAITPLVEAAIPALKAGFEGLAAIVEQIIGYFESAIEVMGRIASKAGELKNAVTGRFTELKDGAVQRSQEMYNGVTGWFNETYDYVVGNSIVPDMVRGVLGEFDFMNDGLLGTMKTIFNNVTSQFNRIKDRVSSSISSITDSFNSIRGRVGGAGSNLFGGLGDLFAGFFANGGMIPAGKFGVVGERGPELVSGPASVTPMNAGGTVVYNINAVDAISFRNMLAREPDFIHAMAQKGARRIPGAR